MAELSMARWTPGGPPPAWVSVSALAGLPPPDAASVLLLSARLDFEQDEDEMTFAHLLGREERARMDRFKVAEARKRNVVGRGLMRSVLARALGCDARLVPIGTGEHGKPILDGEAHPDAPWFNLSHSGNRVLVGFSRMGELGVDIEEIRPRRMMEQILQRNFHPEERAEISTEAGFYRGWAAKEAVVKGLGQGIGYPTASFSTAGLLRGEREITIPVGDRRWRCAELAVDEGYAAALAVEKG